MCGHLSLRLGGFRAKPLGRLPQAAAMQAAATTRSLATAQVLQHSYAVHWLAAEPMSRRIPHKFTAQLRPSRVNSSAAARDARPVMLLEAASAAAGMIQLHDQDLSAEHKTAHGPMRSSQRWLAGGWSLFAQGRLFAPKPRRQRKKHRMLLNQNGMEATCAVLELIQTKRRGMRTREHPACAYLHAAKIIGHVECKSLHRTSQEVF